ncbi:FecR family protein [Negadavirga shengliensis]|uniref:FecR family protein n=1 Tax=Negadavirga shengliensis TaxID=1389218 RepID=A0ABV9T053_9BACT
MEDKTLIKYLLNETSKEEDAAVKEWLADNPGNQQKYDHIQWVWETSRRLIPQSNIDENLAWKRFLDRKAQKEKAAPTPIIRLASSTWFRTAAVFALMVALGWSLVSTLPHAGKAYFSAVSLESGNTSTQQPLLDGSLVTLNKNTQLTYSQKLFDKQRLVNMSAGEAYFEVQKDQKKPFVVKLQNLTVTVLGTSFNVKMKGQTAEIILDEGVVKVEVGGQQVVLDPGEKVTVDLHTGALDKSLQEDQLFRYYVNNRFQAENILLQQVVEALADAYEAEIILGSEDLKSLPITTVLEYGSLDKNLEVIAETLGLQISRDGGRYVLQ